jgi:anti-anti-sigma factor
MPGNLETSHESRPDGITVFTLSGDLFGSPAGYAFQDAVRERLAAGSRGVVVDFGRVVRIDSSGVGILAALMWSASNARSRLVLAALPQRVEKVLSLAMLLEHVDHAASVDEALARLG